MSVVYTKLPDRSFIKIEGVDRYKFLQGLITQDIYALKNQSLIYSCLLTPQGKFLYDFFITEENDTLRLECEGGDRGLALYKRLMMFKLRSNITLTYHDNVSVWQIFDDVYEERAFKDPRHELCGYRTTIQPTNIPEVAFDVWDEYRIKLEIPDGSRDLIPEKSFLHESEAIIKTSVSMTKGCYMGQELVSRMHHRGLAKKILHCKSINGFPEDAEIRSQCNGVALGLVKV